MSSSSSGNKISPAVLFIVVILAIIFFISGILHLLVRYLMKHRFSSQSTRDPEMSDSGSYQRQLQQLFNLHDSGLDQSFIDALPVFLYKEIMGLKEPFDCAVCLCEFSEQDKLRLLPLCSHAFHISCIDTWLLSNSTCPLCRGSLFTPGFCIENPIFYFDDTTRDENGSVVGVGVGVSPGPKLHEDIDSKISSRRVFSVRLGKFKNTNNGILEIGKSEMGETSNSNLDSRRCFSMGSFQYVVADSELQVALCPNSAKNHGLDGGGHQLRGIVKGKSGQNGNSANDGDNYGKRLNLGNRGESFSVSKIWLWSKKDKFHNSVDNVSLPWSDHHRAQPV